MYDYLNGRVISESLGSGLSSQPIHRRVKQSPLRENVCISEKEAVRLKVKFKTLIYTRRVKKSFSNQGFFYQI